RRRGRRRAAPGHERRGRLGGGGPEPRLRARTDLVVGGGARRCAPHRLRAAVQLGRPVLMRRWPVALLLAAAAGGEPAGSVSGKVTVRRLGQPIDASGVVAYLVGFEEPPPARPVEIRQRDKHFVPELVAITAGQSVTFPND